MKKFTIEERVMMNVATVFALRKLVSATALKLYALVLSLGGVVALVSVSNVIANLVKVAEGGVGSVAFFVVSAVLSTTLVVQVALLLGAFAAISLVTPALRSGSRAFA